MTGDRTARGSGDDVISDRNGKRRYVETHSIVNPEAAEGCAPRPGNEPRHKIPNRVGKHREDNAADDVPTTDIEIREPSFKERQDKLEDHQNEGKDDESSYDERKLRPFQWLAETGCDEYPAGEHHGKIPNTEKQPSQLTAQDRPICEAWHRVIKESQECVAQPSEEYALRMVVAKPAPGKPSVAPEKFGKAELGRHQNAE